MIARYHVHDDAKVGAELEVTVDDAAFAYGISIMVARGDERAEVVLDYFNGELVVRQYPPFDMEQIGSMPVRFFREETPQCARCGYVLDDKRLATYPGNEEDGLYCSGECYDKDHREE